MKLRILSLVLLLFLTGCGIPFNRPAVGPDGVIAFFLDKSGKYDFLPEGGTLTLVKEGNILPIPGVSPEGDSGAISWSRDGKEIVFIETELNEWKMPVAWKVELVSVQTDSKVVTLTSADSPITGPAFTPESNITYLQVDDAGNGHLFLYDRIEEVTYPLLRDVLSYRPTKSGADLWVIQESKEGSLGLAHVLRYSPDTGNTEEVASFFLPSPMEQAFFLFPAAFLWDTDPSGRYLALSLYDEALITPEVESAGPSLYLIDTKDNTAERLAERGAAPTFSSNGALLAYIGSENGVDQDTFLYNLSTQETKKIPVSGTTSGLFWIDPGRLGLIAEEDATYHLLTFDLETQEISPLLQD